MSDLKTMPAALAELLRPRRLARVRRTVARSRAEGSLFDAVLFSVFAVVLVGVLLRVVSFAGEPLLAGLGIGDTWLVAASLLVALFGAGALWRWFKWNMLALDLTRRSPGSHSRLAADSISPR
jgi:hypothetical protein